jgi:hypothetical protein
MAARLVLPTSAGGPASPVFGSAAGPALAWLVAAGRRYRGRFGVPAALVREVRGSGRGAGEPI